MRTITPAQLRVGLGEAVDLAASGERVVVERHHRPEVAIVPIEDVQRLEGDTDALRQRRLEALEEMAALGA